MNLLQKSLLRPVNYLEEWKEIVGFKNNLDSLKIRIKEHSQFFFKKLNQSFHEWSSISNESRNLLHQLIPILNSPFDELKLGYTPFLDILELLFKKGNQHQILIFLKELKKNEIIVLSPFHLQQAYVNRLSRVALKIVGNSGLFLNHSFEEEQTQLHLACKYQMFSLVKHLCNLNIAHKQKQDSSGNTVLHYVCGNGNLDIFFYLRDFIDVPSIVNCQNNKGQTPLHLAVNSKVARMLQLLVRKDYQTDIFIKNKIGLNFFQHACRLGDVEMARTCYDIMKVQNGAKASEALANALSQACFTGRYAIVELLVEKYYVDVNSNSWEALGITFHTKKHILTRYLINHPYLDINHREKNKNIFLEIACHTEAKNDVLHAILEKIILTQEDLFGLCLYKRNQLIFEEMEIYWDDVNRPIDHRVVTKGPNSESKPYFNLIHSQSLLNLAALLNNMKLAKHLLQLKGINIDVKDSKGLTPLMGAASNGFKELVKFFIQKNANIHAIDKNQATALHLAALHNRFSVVKILLCHGAGLNNEDNANKTALDYAIKGRAYSTAFYLLQMEKPIINYINEENAVEWLLHIYRKENGALDEIQQAATETILLKSNIDFALEKNSLWEMIYALTIYRKKLVLETLLTYVAQSAGGFDLIKEKLNKADIRGETPFQIACHSGNFEIIKILINFGADSNVLNLNELI
ncbi:MAG: ankyrin repeat domain-containing protein [Candidatus Protochlamydia sp.]|nr:ankyrin repeat domain-containing protein [Candidatus Protochlamydia sp.]